jgi:hypothetical protein
MEVKAVLFGVGAALVLAILVGSLVVRLRRRRRDRRWARRNGFTDDTAAARTSDELVLAVGGHGAKITRALRGTLNGYPVVLLNTKEKSKAGKDSGSALCRQSFAVVELTGRVPELRIMKAGAQRPPDTYRPPDPSFNATFDVLTADPGFASDVLGGAATQLLRISADVPRMIKFDGGVAFGTSFTELPAERAAHYAELITRLAAPRVVRS